VPRLIAAATTLRGGPSNDASAIRELNTGEAFALLDDSPGWSWGYAGEERRVGYVRSDALSAW
jgi:hypothetical protein